jgi:hypothetical protein
MTPGARNGFAIEAFDEFGRARILAIGLVAIPIDDVADRIDADAIEMEIAKEIVHRRHEELRTGSLPRSNWQLPQGEKVWAGSLYS